MLKDDDYFIGYVTRAHSDAQSWITIPDAPGNYKRPEAIREYRQNFCDTALEKAATAAFTGVVSEVTVVDPAGETVLALTAEGRVGPPAVGSEFVRWLLDSEFDTYPYSPGVGFTARRRLWGFGVDQLLRIAGVEAIRYGSAAGLDRPPPLRLWYNNSGALDPYAILTGAVERRLMDEDAVLSYFNLARLAISPGSRSTSSALAARELCLRTGLV